MVVVGRGGYFYCCPLLIIVPFPHCVLSEPLILQGCSISEDEVRQGRDILDTRVDYLIRGLQESQTEAIIYVQLRDP